MRHSPFVVPPIRSVRPNFLGPNTRVASTGLSSAPRPATWMRCKKKHGKRHSFCHNTAWTVQVQRSASKRRNLAINQKSGMLVNSKMSYQHVNSESLPRFYVVPPLSTPRTPYDIEDIRATSVKRTKEGASGPIIGGRQLDWLALKAYIANQLWIFTPNTRQDVDQRIQTLDTFLVDREQGSRRGSDHHGIIRPFCSVHIRRGDKVGSEAREVPIHTYLDAFKKLNVSCRSYFLASDEICNVKPEFEKELRRRLALHEQPPIISTLDYSSQGEPYGNGGYRWGSFLAKQEDCRVQDTIDMLAELEVSWYSTKYKQKRRKGKGIWYIRTL